MTNTPQQSISEAISLIEKKQYEQAIPLLAQSAHFFEQTQAWENYVDAGNNWAEALLRTYQYNEAQQLMEKVLKIALSTVAHKPALMAKGYHIMAKINNAQAMYSKAIHNFQHSLDIYQQILSNNDPIIADICESMGITYLSKGRHDAAIAQHQKSLAIRIAIYGNIHPNVAHAYNDLAIAYHAKCEMDRAIMYGIRTLQIRRQLLGEMNLDTAGSYSNLGAFYYTKGNNEKALACQMKSLEIRTQLLGDEHIKVAHTYNNLGLTMQEKGQNKKAIQYFSKAIQMLKQHNRQFQVVAYAYVNTSLVYIKQKHYNLAIKSLQNGLNYLQQLGEKHPDIAITYFFLAVSYTAKKHYTKALHYYQLALQANCEDFNNPDIYTNPSVEMQCSPAILFRILVAKADCLIKYYKNKTQNFKDLQIAFEMAYMADDLLGQIRQSLLHENTQLALGKEAFELSEQALEAIWLLQEAA